jgi:hypothetical protein
MTTSNSLESVRIELIEMFNNGVTLTNIKRSLTNKGVTNELADMLVRIVELNTK